MAILKRRGIDLPELEQRVRWTMCAVTVLVGVTGLAFKAGLITVVPAYDRLSWYLVSKFAGMTVTKQFDDESTCRKLQTPQAQCRSGKNLIRQSVKSSS